MNEQEKKDLKYEDFIGVSMAIEMHDEILKSQDKRIADIEKDRIEMSNKLGSIEKKMDNFQTMFLEQSMNTQKTILDVFAGNVKHNNDIETVEIKGKIDSDKISISKKWAVILAIVIYVIAPIATQFIQYLLEIIQK